MINIPVTPVFTKSELEVISEALHHYQRQVKDYLDDQPFEDLCLLIGALNQFLYDGSNGVPVDDLS